MDHRFDSLKYCLSGGSLVYGKRAYMKDWIDMENKNEWETIDTLTKDSNKTLMHVYVRETKDGYEYRLQRRKKAKEMPELKPGDKLRWESYKNQWVFVSNIEGNTVHYYCNLDGKYSSRTICELEKCDFVTEIHRNGTEIWRRE